MLRKERGEDPELRRLLKQYVEEKTSIPPPRDTPTERQLLVALAEKMESLDRTRHDLAKQLGASVRDSGTFTPLGQDQLDNMMLRAENQRLTKENEELKLIIKTWTDRKNEWTIRVVLAAVGTLMLYVWTLITAAKK